MQTQQETQGEKETGRLEAFSDGVFAIAITLLVLELRVPAMPAGGATSAILGKALLQLWPSYLALITSFFTILIMWVHHHAILRNVHRTDAWLHFTNGCLLLLITFVPYPTSVLAAYLRTPAAKMAAAFYSGTFVLVALCFSLFTYGAFRPHLLAHNASKKFIEATLRSYRMGPPTYLLATLAAFLDARLSVGICALLCLYWAAVTTRHHGD
jgi:uncharacterized membrane protein